MKKHSKIILFTLFLVSFVNHQSIAQTWQNLASDDFANPQIGISDAAASYSSIALDANAVPYLEYITGNKATVKNI